jgi:serine protease Do
MQNRAFGLGALLAVIGVSIVFGMLLGGKLNPPPVMLAAPSGTTLQLTPPVYSGGLSTNFADIVEQSLPAVVSVTSTARGGDQDDDDGHRQFFEDPFFRRWFGQPEDESRPRLPQRRVGSGSGFIISPDGYVMTNNHVIQDFDKVGVTLTNGDSYSAQVVGTDPSIDLALLKIDAEGVQLPTLPLGDSSRLRVGEWVIAIGNPYEFDQTVTVGVVSGKERRVPLPNTDGGVVSFIQTDAAINLGNSGGPLLDARGNVVGINTAIRRQNFAEGIGFALPINQVSAVVQQLIEQGEVRRGWIGIRMSGSGIDEATREYYHLPDTNGVLVTWIDPDGPARKAGLNKWDVIREVDEDPIRDNLDMIAKISSRQPGEKVKLNVLRQGKPLNMRITLGDREQALLAEAGGEPGRQPRGPGREPEESTGLGVTVESLGSRTRDQFGLGDDIRGVLITDVDFESEADDKGLRPTMIITAVNDNPVGSVSEWVNTMEGLHSGSPVKLDIMLPGSDQVIYFFLRVPESR